MSEKFLGILKLVVGALNYYYPITRLFIASSKGKLTVDSINGKVSKV